MRKANTKPKTRKLVTVPRLVILCLLILVLIMGAWIYVRGAVVKSFVGSIANLESQNYQIGHDGLSISGFPFSVTAETNNVRIRAPISDKPDPTKNWSVKSDNLYMYSATLTPLSWNLEHRGQMRIDMRGRSGERYMFDIMPAAFDGRVVYSMAGTLKSARIDIGRGQLDSLIGTPPIISQFGEIGAEVNVLNNTGQISMSATDIRLSPKIPSMLDNILGRKLALVELDVNIENWARLETQGAEPWIAANSRIKSEHWTVRWGRADIIGDFDITFKNGLPEGTVHMHIKRPEPLLQKLIDNKLIPGQYAGMAKTLIALQKTEDDGRKSIEITIKDGVVKTGFIPIYKF